MQLKGCKTFFMPNPQENKINIAIDGHSSSGKSTLAKDLAKALGYIYIDSGAMYRSVARYLIDNTISVFDQAAVLACLDDIEIDIQPGEDKMLIYLNGKEVSESLRLPEISNIVSEVAAIPAIRTKLVKIQQAIGAKKGVVMDGRDIGTIVFPHAELKLFVTANNEIRAERRYKELKNKQIEVSLQEVLQNLKHRDHIDSTRSVGPLIQADDAIKLDNSSIDRNQQLNKALELFEQIRKSY